MNRIATVMLLSMALLASACGKDDPCQTACDKLTSCGLCLQDNTGACLSAENCTSVCGSVQGGDTAATCVNDVSGCNSQAFSACLGGGGGGNDCTGCVWDGTSCTYYSQSNWGQGPWSGAAISCNPACCGR